MLLSAATQPGYGTQPFNGADSRAPSTPFAVTMERAKATWKDDFFAGLQQGLGVRVVPLSDAQTPNVATTGGGVTQAAQTLLANPVVAWGLVAAIGYLVYKKVR